MPSSDNLLLLTGATGFIGFRTLIRALEAGYSVRCAIRAEAKASDITSAPTLKALNLPDGVLSFSIVPDITVSGAYDEAIKNVTHVIHVASPLSTQNMEGHKNAEEVFIKPAVNGALEMLRAAKRTPSVKKVVITSSAVGLMPPKVWGGIEKSDQQYTADSRTPNVHGPYETPGVAYAASKIASLNATDHWVAAENPAFDIVNVHPSWVVGPAEIVHSREEFLRGTNKYLAAVALGRVNEITGIRLLSSATVHIDDVARVHVMALQPNIKGYRGFITSTPMVWDDIPSLAAKTVPKGVEDGLFVSDEKQATATVHLISADTERIFDFKFKNLEEQVKDTLTQYVSLPEKA